MAFGNPTFSDAAGAVSDILGGEATAAGLRLKAAGDVTEAQDYTLASQLASENSEFTKQSTQIKQTQQQRQIYMGLGTTSADIQGAGFTMSGTALDLMRSGAQQGALTKQVLGQQGLITEAGYDEQADAYNNMAAAATFAANTENDMADTASTNGMITGGIKGVAALATLFM